MRADWRPAPARRASHRPHSATHAQSPRDPPLEPWLTASSTSHRRRCINPTHLLESSISCMVIIRPCMHAGGQPKLAARPTGRTPRPERSPARTYTRPRPHETYLLAYLIPHPPGGPWPVFYQRVTCHNLFACNLPAHHRNPPQPPHPGGEGTRGATGPPSRGLGDYTRRGEDTALSGHALAPNPAGGGAA